MSKEPRKVEYKDMPPEAQKSFPFSPIEDYKFLYMPSRNAFRASLVYEKALLQPEYEVYEWTDKQWYLYLSATAK